MELLPLLSAYLVCSTALGIALGKLVARRDAWEPARPVRKPAATSKRARVSWPTNEGSRRR
jgi:hypothetical protein